MGVGVRVRVRVRVWVGFRVRILGGVPRPASFLFSQTLLLHVFLAGEAGYSPDEVDAAPQGGGATQQQAQTLQQHLGELLVEQHLAARVAG